VCVCVCVCVCYDLFIRQSICTETGRGKYKHGLKDRSKENGGI